MFHALFAFTIVLLSLNSICSAETSDVLDTRQYPEDFVFPIIELTNDNIKSAVALWLDDEENNRTLVEQTYGGPIGSWNVTGVTSLDEVFADVQMHPSSSSDDSNVIDLSSWDVSRVTSMRALFFNTANLAVNVASWDTSQVRDMRVILAYATNFQGDISGWSTASLAVLRAAFAEYYASSAPSQNSEEDTLAIASWTTPELTDMEGLFAGTTFFKTDLTGWTTSKVTNMAFMLENTTNFYGGDLSTLDTSSVVSMEHMFAGAVNVRGARDIASEWDTSKVQNMHRIFYNTTVTFDDGTAPADTDLFYLCWNLDSLDASGLNEAFCHSNAGGFNCGCVRDDMVDQINTGCNTTRKTCFDSMMAGGGEAEENQGVGSVVDLTSGAHSQYQSSRCYFLFVPVLVLSILSMSLQWC